MQISLSMFELFAWVRKWKGELESVEAAEKKEESRFSFNFFATRTQPRLSSPLQPLLTRVSREVSRERQRVKSNSGQCCPLSSPLLDGSSLSHQVLNRFTKDQTKNNHYLFFKSKACLWISLGCLHFYHRLRNCGTRFVFTFVALGQVGKKYFLSTLCFPGWSSWSAEQPQRLCQRATRPRETLTRVPPWRHWHSWPRPSCPWRGSRGCPCETSESPIPSSSHSKAPTLPHIFTHSSIETKWKASLSWGQTCWPGKSIWRNFQAWPLSKSWPSQAGTQSRPGFRPHFVTRPISVNAITRPIRRSCKRAGGSKLKGAGCVRHFSLFSLFRYAAFLARRWLYQVAAPPPTNPHFCHLGIPARLKHASI